MNSPFLVSAPGKVIIFGEHSAVYGKPAIAAALNLRAYLLVTPSADPNTVRLDFPDINLSHTWNISDIPWEEGKKYVKELDERPTPSEELIPELNDLLGECLFGIESTKHYNACRCFLYLYLNLCNREVSGNVFCVKSALPIGAGLGSSAATSVCLVTAMALLGRHIKRASHSYNMNVASSKNNELEFIDKWSLVGEMCFHGNPSGIDNAVATYGGAIMFQRSTIPSSSSVRNHMRNFPPFKLLLTNTKIPRSTANLVGKVAELNSSYPKCTGSILDAMNHLVYGAYQIMLLPSFGEEERMRLRRLVEVNHGLLVALGVSHPELEKVKIITEESKIGSTKLTGAGGGGCAVSLMNDDVTDEKVKSTITTLEKEGYEAFITFLGGRGVGLLAAENTAFEGSDEIFSLGKFAVLEDSANISKELSKNLIEYWRYW